MNLTRSLAVDFLSYVLWDERLSGNDEAPTLSTTITAEISLHNDRLGFV